MNKRSFLFLASSFIVGFSLMTVELTASRIVAPYVGSSVYTWTSVIGVVLFGLSLGYYLGGFFADKYIGKNLIWIFYILSAASVAVIPKISFLAELIAKSNFLLLPSILLITLILFFLPSIFLGALSPIILRQYALSFEKIASSAGILSALWSIGSIIGTFATGFLFMGYMGSSATVFCIALLLLLSSLFFCKLKIEVIVTIIIIIITSSFLLFGGVNNVEGKVLFYGDSDYYRIKVIDGDFEGVNDVRVLFLDFDPNSVESKSGEFLGGYPDIYPLFSKIKDSIKNIYVIGGGSYSLPKHLADYYKDSSVIVAEIDPKVTEIAGKYFNLGNYRILTNTGDGRILLSKDNSQYDLIFEDAFNSFISLPWHLTTNEFTEMAKSKLSNGGIYAVNFISTINGQESKFFQSMLKTFLKVFPNAYVFTTNSISYHYPQSVVLIGINSEIHEDISEIRANLANLDNGIWLESHIFDSDIYLDEDGVVLTDDFAPVERLMIPVMNQYFGSYSNFYYSFIGQTI